MVSIENHTGYSVAQITRHHFTFLLVTNSGGSKGWPGEGPRPPLLWENSDPPWAPNETGCKIAAWHNSSIHSMASRSLCLITPLTKSCIISFGILAPLPPKGQIQMWPLRCPLPAAGHPKLLQLETPLVTNEWIFNFWMIFGTTLCPNKKHVTTFSTISLTINVRLQ